MQSQGSLFKELLSKQIENIEPEKKLLFADMRRICKYIKTSIFDQKICCIWNGYITNMNNCTKGTYINFYFKKKKKALHRLLYINFVGPLTDNEYLKFSCGNKGYCCNIHHLNKFYYKKLKNTKQSTKAKEEKAKAQLEKAKKTNLSKKIEFTIKFD